MLPFVFMIVIMNSMSEVIVIASSTTQSFQTISEIEQNPRQLSTLTPVSSYSTSRLLTGEMEYVVTSLAGLEGAPSATNGIGTNSRFNVPQGVSVSPDGVYALVADRGNLLIRKIIISTASVTTFAGVAGSSGSTNGIGTISKFNRPFGVSISPDGVYALIGDYTQHLGPHC